MNELRWVFYAKGPGGVCSIHVQLEPLPEGWFVHFAWPFPAPTVSPLCHTTPQESLDLAESLIRQQCSERGMLVSGPVSAPPFTAESPYSRRVGTLHCKRIEIVGPASITVEYDKSHPGRARISTGNMQNPSTYYLDLVRVTDEAVERTGAPPNSIHAEVHPRTSKKPFIRVRHPQPPDESHMQAIIEQIEEAITLYDPDS